MELAVAALTQQGLQHTLAVLVVLLVVQLWFQVVLQVQPEEILVAPAFRQPRHSMRRLLALAVVAVVQCSLAV